MITYQDLMKQTQDWYKPFVTAPMNTLKYFQFQVDLYNKSVDLSIQWVNDIINAKIGLAEKATNSFSKIFK